MSSLGGGLQYFYSYPGFIILYYSLSFTQYFDTVGWLREILPQQYTEILLDPEKKPFKQEPKVVSIASAFLCISIFSNDC